MQTADARLSFQQEFKQKLKPTLKTGSLTTEGTLSVGKVGPRLKV